VPSSPHNFAVLETKAHLGPNLGLGACQDALTPKSQLMQTFFPMKKKVSIDQKWQVHP